MSSRQERRKEERLKSKKIGQLLAVKNELNQPAMRVKEYVAKRNSLFRLENDLIDLGVIKKPSLWQRFIGRLKATFRIRRHLRVIK